MASEISIAKPLSGSECLEACLEALRRTLSRDDRFQSHMSYSAFHATLRVQFRPAMSFIPDLDRTLEVQEGDQDDLELTPTVDEILDLPPQPPNAVREEAGLPQPVLVTNPDGTTEEKWVQRGHLPGKKNRVPANVK